MTVVNAVSSYLDMSQVYGSTAVIADALRTFKGGLLKTSPGNMLPYDNSTYFTATELAAINMANDSGAVATQNLFVTGDVRGNENVELTALQTLFVRNHEPNRGRAAERTSDVDRRAALSGGAQAQQCRVPADHLSVLSAGLTRDRVALPKYTGYNAKVNPSVATEFSTVAFRFGHSLLKQRHRAPGQQRRGRPPQRSRGCQHQPGNGLFRPETSSTPGASWTRSPSHFSTDIGPDSQGRRGRRGPRPMICWRSTTSATCSSATAVPPITDQDLIARDDGCSVDDGIGSYNQVRVAYGLPAVTSFAQITSNVTVQKELKEVYGSVANIDPFEGGLAVEITPRDPTWARCSRASSSTKSTRLRDGDKFFYGNETFNKDELNIMQQGNTLAKVIEANTNITNLQSDVFLFKASIRRGWRRSMDASAR